MGVEITTTMKMNRGGIANNRFAHAQTDGVGGEVQKNETFI